jgi:hypothetical protein
MQEKTPDLGFDRTAIAHEITVSADAGESRFDSQLATSSIWWKVFYQKTYEQGVEDLCLLP